jgi:hypothetical protein
LHLTLTDEDIILILKIFNSSSFYELS